ncbi:hypothetical protein EON79_07875 [bacterium]|nr:MAG: hypothetical protein EON79_07875 [bacterium]
MAATADSLYEALYECLRATRLPAGTHARPGDLARETDLRGCEGRLITSGVLRLIGYVRRGAKMG